MLHLLPPLSTLQRVMLWDDAFTGIRRHFSQAGLREVSTAIRVSAPAIEADIDVIGADGLYLATSPELAMKQLLAQGSGPLYQIAHAFRRETAGPLHREEFHLLEWYRLGDGLDEVLGDVEAVVNACFVAAGTLADAGTPAPERWIRASVLDLIAETTGVRLEGREDAVQLQARLGEKGADLLEGAPPLEPSPDDAAGDDEGKNLGTWHAFFTAWSNTFLSKWMKNQGNVGIHLCDFPAALSAMALTSEIPWNTPPTTEDHGPRDLELPKLRRQYAHRFESFVGGIECANGYRELRDPQVQRNRLQNANHLRLLRGLPALPLDEAFLAALQNPGLPPCAGVAMGLDRLLMIAVGARSLDDISPHPALSTPPPSRTPAGKKSLQKLDELVSHQLITPEQATILEPVTHRFQMAVSPKIRALMTGGNPESAGPEGNSNPLRRQFIPDLAELNIAPQERADPIGDRSFSPVEGLVHRYPDRVLLLPTLLCPVYCRFCFRREVVGDPEKGVLTPERLEGAMAYIRAHPAIGEVILTGGDPLILSVNRIGAILTALAQIPHVKVVRIHTRVPLVSPERITPALVKVLKTRLALYIVLHSNHASELSIEGQAALARLVDAGIPLLSQTVLLKGVNNDVATLTALLKTLVENRVKPYYLHHPDLAEGTGHFRVSIDEGQRLMRALRGNISGLCQPTYVLDIPGGYGKVPIGPSYLHEGASNTGPKQYQVADPWGGVHLYDDLGNVGPEPGEDG